MPGQIKIRRVGLRHIKHFSKIFFWFSVGVFLGLFLMVSFTFIIFRQLYKDKIYPGITVNGVNFGGKTEDEVRNYFLKKNKAIENSEFTFQSSAGYATISAQMLHVGYDANLAAQQAMSIGRTNDTLANIGIITTSYVSGVSLTSPLTYTENTLFSSLDPLIKQLTVQPTDAQFSFTNGRVNTFRPSSDGQEVDKEKLRGDVLREIKRLLAQKQSQSATIALQTKVLKPQITTEKANNFGIKELIGSGTSLFQHSIDTRIYNVELAASRINGVLIAPGEVFSFDKALGDVSAFTGYKSAYVIENGKTVLGDGGGVCQVSTTFFRAALNAGLPIVERHAHAYRVGYYEEDSPPGIDATIYVPNVDLKVKNDTGHYILVQSVIDSSELRLTFYFYGTKDDRQVMMSTPVVTNETPAPQPKYQDDLTLPKGVVKQVDFAAAGANVYFTRQVIKNGKVTINDKFVSNFQPWQAVFLRGTQ